MDATMGGLFSRENRLGLSARVQAALLELIVAGILEPDQPLRIDALSTRLGVSATPVREALVRMEASGIVTRETNKGFRVAPRLDPQDLDDLFEARITLEARLAQLACRHVSSSMLEGMAEALETQRSLSQDGSLEAFTGFLEADRRFHGLIAEAANNRFLSTALESLGSHVQRYRSFDELVVTDRQETLVEHKAILDAVAAANPRAAELAMTMHLSNLRGRVQLERQAHPAG